MKKLFAIILLIYCATLSAAETTGYRIVHPDGTVEFTDDATRGGDEIKLRDVQTLGKKESADEGEGEKSKQEERDQEAKQSSSGNSYTSLVITSPTDNGTVWFEEKGMMVNVSATPQLQNKDVVVIELDGVPRARGRAMGLNVGLVYRGTHTVVAKIVDAQGNTLITSSSATFFMRQHTAN